MTITIKKDSHKNKKNFQIDHQEALKILGPDFKIPRNEKLPVFETRSKYAIIGGGFGGIASALKILKTLQSEDFVIFDKYSEFGGTWLVNTYPGAASDIPSIWYSFHEEMNSNWSSPQPPQYEIEEYILSVVEKYKLRKHARFSTIISQCKWDDVSQTWEISATNLKTGQKVVHYSQYILNCIGGLALVNHFNAPGLSDFKGEYMHTAIWNSDVSLKDKDVVVVGNGCSATQLIPYLARDYDVKSVTQVVRSKHYIMPPIPSFIQPLYELFASTWLGLFLVRMLVIFLGEIRWPLFKGEGWLAQKVRANTLKESLDYMNKECPEEYKDAVIPTFKIGCKRLVVDHDYLETLHNPIVDLKSSLIKEVKSNSVVLEDGSEIHADVIIACTGYSVTRTMASIEFIGRDDMKVSDLWGKEGISAYNTTLVKNCPNLFLIGGVCISFKILWSCR